jgi:hypothetical protein
VPPVGSVIIPVIAPTSDRLQRYRGHQLIYRNASLTQHVRKIFCAPDVQVPMIVALRSIIVDFDGSEPRGLVGR